MEILNADFLNSEFFQNLLIFGFSTATGCIAYFAKQIMKNNRDLSSMHNDIKYLTKQAVDLKMYVAEVEQKIEDHQEEQNNAEQGIVKEISRLSTMVDLYYKNWDGIDRRKS